MLSLCVSVVISLAIQAAPCEVPRAAAVVVLAAAWQNNTLYDRCGGHVDRESLDELAEAVVDEAFARGWGLYGALFVGALIQKESGCRMGAVSPAGAVCAMQILPGRWGRPKREALIGSVSLCIQTGVEILANYSYQKAWGNRGTVRLWWGHYSGGNWKNAHYARAVLVRYRALLKAAGMPCEWWDPAYPYRGEICRKTKPSKK